MKPVTARRRTGSQSAQTSSRVAGSRRHRADHRLMLFMGLLILVGLIVLFAISPYQIHRINTEGGSLDQSHYMFKQLAYLGIGTGAFIAGSLLPLALWRKVAGPLVITALTLCALLALLGAFSAPPAMCFNGACRWFDLGFISFQPAEFLKFAVVVFAAVFLGQRMKAGKINNVQDTLVPIVILLGLAMFFVIGLQKDMGTGITIVGALIAMMIVSGVSLRLLAIGGAGILALGSLLIMLSPHRVERIVTFLNHSSVTDANSYHIDMAKVAIGSGGLFGKGLGNGVQAFGYLPEALNDSIFAVLGEIFGFIGLVIILGMFAALLARIMRTSERVSDPTMKLLAAGGFGWIATHVVVNIGAMTGILPLTGVTLPFLSFGGTSLLFMMATLGIIYQISRYTTFQLETKGGSDETSRSGRRFRGARNPGSSRHKRAI
ncbi:MAG: FtsW/RodA/SpoVE family cell cycle protein [Candidatus Saccharimonadales bacterium]